MLLSSRREFYNESGFQKVMRRMKREPLIPLGVSYPQGSSSPSSSG